MEDYQDRLITEKVELSEKLELLKLFLRSHRINDVTAIDHARMQYQALLMSEYRSVLDIRIKAFI